MKKEINTIKMAREIREKQYSKIQNKTNKEIIDYFKNRSKKLKNGIQSVGTWNNSAYISGRNNYWKLFFEIL